MTTRDQAKQFAMECWEDAVDIGHNEAEASHVCAALACEALVGGGPTRCGRCAKGRPPDLVERFDTFSEAVPLSADEVAEILADEGVDAKAALARTLESIAADSVVEELRAALDGDIA